MVWTRRSAAVSVLLAMDEYRKQVGQRVLALREARGWTHATLAHEAGVSDKTISRVENGRHEMRGNTLQKLAAALGVEESAIRGQPPPPLGLGDDEVDLAALLIGIDRKLDLLLADKKPPKRPAKRKRDLPRHPLPGRQQTS